jgi:hypothetical protein
VSLGSVSPFGEASGHPVCPGMWITDAVFIDLKRITVDHMQIKAHRSKD